MDLFTRCVLGLRLTPVSTKSVDVASVLFEVLSPPEAPPEWPAEAAWPYHGVPESAGRGCRPGLRAAFHRAGTAAGHDSYRSRQYLRV